LIFTRRNAAELREIRALVSEPDTGVGEEWKDSAIQTARDWLNRELPPGTSKPYADGNPDEQSAQMA
jgi:hypothetical protein